MKFLVDMPVTPGAAEHLSAAGHDAVHVSTIGLFSAPDQEILEKAREEDRVVVTADLDYPRLLALHGSAGPGVILFRGGSYSDKEMLALLDRVLERLGGSELAHSLTIVDRKRIRRHPLPITE